MKKNLVVITTLIAIWSCQKPSSQIVGTWKVTDYQNELLIDYPEDKKITFIESVNRQRAKMVEFESYHFNKDGSYRLDYSPQRFDIGNWEIIDDSLLIYNSTKYNKVDTSVIYFNDKKNAVITMQDETQKVSVSIQKTI